MEAFAPRKYIKDESYDPIYNPVNKRFLARARIIPALIVTSGIIVLITQVIAPLVFFKTADEITKPVANTLLGTATGFGNFEYKELGAPGQAQNAGSPSDSNDANIPQYFYLTVPKLRIKDAIVETNSTNLAPDTSLGHYKGSALPGQVGNTFIYGHSVLPWFYNPRNYKTIFSTLNTLKPGDEIFIKYNNVEYKYVVETKEIKKPDEVNPVANYKPKYLNESTITLMTCDPPGTKINRLMVNAILARN